MSLHPSKNMRNFGPFGEVQGYLYQYKYGSWYFNNKFYFNQFLNLKQRELSIDAYTRQFQELQCLCPLKESESHCVARMRGLKLDRGENEVLPNYSRSIQRSYPY